jgi:hypothetical protein
MVDSPGATLGNGALGDREMDGRRLSTECATSARRHN